MSLIIVSGAIANKPFNGGEAWVRLSWVRGLERLSEHVLFVEQIDVPEKKSQPGASNAGVFERQVEYFAKVISHFGLNERAALIDAAGRRIWGMSARELRDAARRADALINISGNLTCPSVKYSIRTRAYVDLDPGYTQFWQREGHIRDQLEDHDFYFTVGENIGGEGCEIPTNGLAWQPIRQPVVLADWSIVESAALDRFTTVGSWRGAFGPVEVGDRVYGQKVHEHRKFVQLPRIVNQRFELALDIHPTEVRDRELLCRNGWKLFEPQTVARGPTRFREYVRNSGAEFSVAQGLYVETHSGWFSDRTVRYLASGKPALVQDTGFSGTLPTGEGLLAFSNMDEAVAGAEAIAANYRRHCRAARSLAESYFDSDRVLLPMLEVMGIGSSAMASAGP